MKAVIFDFGGTLDTNGVHWSEKFWEAYQRHGVLVSKKEFEEAYVAAERRLTNGVLAPSDGLLRTLEEQVSHQFKELRKKKNLPSELPQRIASACYADVKKTILHLRPLLEACRRQFRLGLVSNFYGNLVAVCKDLNIDSLFDCIIDSNLVGVRKPNAQIFNVALDRLHIEPSKAIVVGDSYKRDIVPAKSIGCFTVWLRGKSWSEPEDTSMADSIIHSLDDLHHLLKLNVDAVSL